MLEISEAGSAWPSTAAPDRGLGRPVAGRGRALIRASRLNAVVDLDQGSTGRVGYVCAVAMRGTASSAAAPARCRKFRRGRFILNLPLASHDSITMPVAITLF